ncbi:MAG TPA: Asp-tRNA(Asn)/Glu-tRNA(Gln) amidotransferase subunit GatB [Candidatus Dormibacteraeota bacterium]
MAEWEVVIGMETHVQLRTASKMFCSCSTDYLGAPPNSYVCPTCLGLPGALPAPNRVAIEQVLRTAIALHCEIPRHSKFDRKNYFYPDLPKGYQISQYDLPLSLNGWIEVGGRRIRIRRAHLEEDTGSLKHAGDALHSAEESLVDLNRSGVPLMEIVTEPDLTSAEQARDYGLELRRLLRWIGASEADMEKGQLRVEPNISVRPAGSSELGVKTELKNLNSFRALHLAVQFEIDRQIRVLEGGGAVVQETRGWSEAERRTFSQRTKEYAEDYRYFPEPDIPPLEVAPEWVDRLRAGLPELPADREARFRSAYALSAQDAAALTGEREVGEYFEAVVAAGVEAKPAANWVVQEVVPTGADVPAERLAGLISLVQSGRINRDQGREVLAEMRQTGRGPAEIVGERGLAQLSDEGELVAVVDRVLAENASAVADFRAGKQQAIGALLGAVSQATGRRANMKVARELLEARLSRS